MGAKKKKPLVINEKKLRKSTNQDDGEGYGGERESGREGGALMKKSVRLGEQKNDRSTEMQKGLRKATARRHIINMGDMYD